MPADGPPPPSPGWLTRQHQPPPDLWLCLMDASGGTGRGWRQEAASKTAMGASQEKPSQSGGLLHTSSVRVAGVVTQCCIQRIVLALPLPDSVPCHPVHGRLVAIDAQVAEVRRGDVPPDARRRTASSPHPCRTYGVGRPAETLDSTAVSCRSLIRMRPLVQVQPGPQY